jgi:hypothetical protein
VRGRNHLWQTYEAGRADPGWYTALMRASATGQLSQEELLSARQTMTEEQYSSEFGKGDGAGISRALRCMSAASFSSVRAPVQRMEGHQKS